MKPIGSNIEMLLREEDITEERYYSLTTVTVAKLSCEIHFGYYPPARLGYPTQGTKKIRPINNI